MLSRRGLLARVLIAGALLAGGGTLAACDVDGDGTLDGPPRERPNPIELTLTDGKIDGDKTHKVSIPKDNKTTSFTLKLSGEVGAKSARFTLKPESNSDTSSSVRAQLGGEIVLDEKNSYSSERIYHGLPAGTYDILVGTTNKDGVPGVSERALDPEKTGHKIVIK